MKGLILAAGRGERLRPWSKFIPKALIPIKDRPLISYPILQFKKAGIKDLGIVIRPQDYFKFRSSLKNYKFHPVRSPHQRCGSRLWRLTSNGVKIKFIFQKKPHGTAKAVELCRDYIGNERFLLSWCDFLSPFDFRKIIRYHLKYKPSATILINKEKDPSGTAQVQFRGPYITKIVEKPLRRFSFWGLTGLLVLEPKDFFPVFPKIKPSALGEYHIPDALQYLINQGKIVRFLKIDTWRVNINTLEDLKCAISLISRS